MRPPCHINQWAAEGDDDDEREACFRGEVAMVAEKCEESAEPLKRNLEDSAIVSMPESLGSRPAPHIQIPRHMTTIPALGS